MKQKKENTKRGKGKRQNKCHRFDTQLNHFKHIYHDMKQNTVGKYYDNAQSVSNRFHSLKLNRIQNYFFVLCCCCCLCISLSIFRIQFLSFLFLSVNQTLIVRHITRPTEKEKTFLLYIFGNNLCSLLNY